MVAEKVGKQANMVSETWDGERVYVTSSLLANWDKNGEDDEQFLKAYRWDGKSFARLFAVDFHAAKLGRPHIMHFGQDASTRTRSTPPPRRGSPAPRES